MPPRRFRQAQAQEPSSATIEWLSDDLLAKCFAPLGQKDRLCRAALVCRRWHAVTLRPEMLREVAFKADEDPDGALSAAHSLLRWLKRHGQAVRSLNIVLQGCEDFDNAQAAEFVCLLDNWVALCSGGLVKCSVYMEEWSDFTLGGWVATATSLQELAIQGMQTLHTWATLNDMTALQRLDVYAEDWQLRRGVDLPASLTYLRISSH